MAAVPAATASADYSSTLDNYSNLRDQLRQCNMDSSGWDQLSESSRRECDDLFGKYVLFADPSQNEAFYIHCRSASNCIPTPDGFPDAAGPIPEGSYVYDMKPRSTSTRAKSAARHRHKRHTSHHH